MAAGDASIYDIQYGGGDVTGGSSGTTGGLSAGNGSVYDIQYGTADPLAFANIGVPSPTAGSAPGPDGSSTLPFASNPNPSGSAWAGLTGILTAAQNSFQSYVKASPQVGVPPPRLISTYRGTGTLYPAGISLGSPLVILAIVGGLFWIWHSSRRG